MSQHDYNLANDTGANFRADLNNALSAIATNNSGTTEPLAPFAFQWWVDTSVTPKLLKLRNSANTAWWSIGTVEADGFGKLSLAGGTMTGQLLSVVGSAAAPGVAFAGDTNTGIYWISADKFAVVVGGAAVMTFDSATYTQHTTNTAILMPVGTSAQRPTGASGLMRFNSDLGQFEGFAGGLWKPVGSGGGGAGFTWKELAGTAPGATEENGEQPYLFSAGISQELYAAVKIPQSYSSGTQIKIFISAYSPSASGTILMQAQSTLIKKDTDAFTSTTNQRTTTNAALTNTVANMMREFVLDITDASGLINGVAVAAGDIIKVRLYRSSSDTDTADLRMLPNATDVKFS